MGIWPKSTGDELQVLTHKYEHNGVPLYDLLVC